MGTTWFGRDCVWEAEYDMLSHLAAPSQRAFSNEMAMPPRTVARSRARADNPISEHFQGARMETKQGAAKW